MKDEKMSDYNYNIGDAIDADTNSTMHVVRQLAMGYVLDHTCDYIEECSNNRIEVYEVAAADGHHEIVVRDNASCWIWGDADDAERCSEHLALFERADITPDGWIEYIDDTDLRDYVAGCVCAALEYRAESEIAAEDAEVGERYRIRMEGERWSRTVYRNATNAEEALRTVSEQHNVGDHTQLMYDADTRGGRWATWCCTDPEGAMRGVRITAERCGEEVR